MVELGPAAPRTLGELGVDVSTVHTKGRQRFAFECLDATERAPHLAGALADGLARSMFDGRWITRERNSRTITLTPTGKRRLKRTLGL